MAFFELKNAIALRAMLTFPLLEALLILELTTDASKRAAGAVLHQMIEGEKCPLAFISRKFTEAETLKSAFDGEPLAIYTALKKFDWLLGQHLTILTDQKPQVNALTMETPTPQQARWISYISEFNCVIKDVDGAENVVADTLSRDVFAITSTNEGELAKAQAEDPELSEIF